jgi:predicted nucleotidyltransferase
MAKKEIIELLERYIALLKTEGISVNKAFLYGSYSSDTETRNSDIDLMIVTNNSDADNDFIIGKIWKLTRKIDTKIEPFLVGLDKFKQNENSPLIEIVKKNGIKIA